jgi:hypothetical protein
VRDLCVVKVTERHNLEPRLTISLALLLPND